MKNINEKVYFYTKLDEINGKGNNDICYGFNYNEDENIIKLHLDGDEIEFNIIGDIREYNQNISFNTDHNSKITLTYLDVELYNNLKGYMLNYNLADLKTDEEVQQYLKQKRFMS
ncbi:hypothetical protein [Clostridium massiliamazoniense]|uniref:hypothetical protein n=1 Tax=Clostridium massiliamazoniense TaxID=1347366 RepID=UPI0006D76595|nr:hypothetical protein [Clostridium massiliamazoniense]